MKILIVCSFNHGQIAPFIADQANELINNGLSIDFFKVEGKGWTGYLKNYPKLIRKIKDFTPDLIHAHYGLSGLLANLQRRIPVVTTYHGSDINLQKPFIFSSLSILLSAFNIFVSEKNFLKASKLKVEKAEIIPCGTDLTLFKPIKKSQARLQLKLSENEKLVLFAGSFENKIKNPELAFKAINQIHGVKLIELKGYKRDDVAVLMNAVDVCLLTSFSEGSPQFIKEALACNCPVVSVDVGDVKKLIAELSGCYICENNKFDIAEKVKIVLDSGIRIQGRQRIIDLELDNKIIIGRLISVYKCVIK